MKRARFPIGLQFQHYTDRKGPRTIVDILTTTNHAGEVVRIEYVTTRDFLGQPLQETWPDITIARSLPLGEFAKYDSAQES